MKETLQIPTPHLSLRLRERLQKERSLSRKGKLLLQKGKLRKKVMLRKKVKLGRRSVSLKREILF